MKKIFVFLIIFFQITFVYAENLSSNNDFPFLLEEKDIPEGNGGDSSSKDSDSGLSGGAITAITLGSIGVVGTGTLLYFLYQKFAKEGLTLTKMVGCDCPILPICLDKNSTNLMCAKYPENTLLKKALKENGIRKCPNSKYVLIPDTEIQNKTYHTYIFSVNEDSSWFNNIKITQAKQYDGIKIIYNLYENKEQESEVNLLTLKNINNILMKNGSITNQKYGVLTVVCDNLKLKNNETQKYAIVVELFR